MGQETPGATATARFPRADGLGYHGRDEEHPVTGERLHELGQGALRRTTRR